VLFLLMLFMPAARQNAHAKTSIAKTAIFTVVVLRDIKVSPKLVIPLHWDNFFSRLDKPAVGMPSLIEKTPVVFFKLAEYLEDHDIDFLLQIPRTSITL
jgi:hypothetical protein